MLRVTISIAVVGWLVCPRAVPAGENPLEISDFRALCSFGVCEFCAGEPVSFVIEYTGAPEVFSYDWDGDGGFDQFSTVPIAAHTYTTPMSDFFPRARISAGGEADVFTHVLPLGVADCGPLVSITVSGPTVREVGQSGDYTASATVCTPSANGWSWTATGGGEITGDVDSDQVKISWSFPGLESVTASNSSCGVIQGTRFVEIVASGDLLFIDGFESGDVSAWSSSNP